MITFLILSIITVLALGIAISVIGIGGAFFLTIGADIIVAVGIVWLIFKFIKKKN